MEYFNRLMLTGIKALFVTLCLEWGTFIGLGRWKTTFSGLVLSFLGLTSSRAGLVATDIA